MWRIGQRHGEETSEGWTYLRGEPVPPSDHVEYRLSNGTIHQTELQPGELKEISGGEVVKGGSTVKFTVIGMTPTASSHRQRIPVQVTVDGNVLVKVFTFTEGGAEVEGGTALPPEN